MTENGKKLKHVFKKLIPIYEKAVVEMPKDRYKRWLDVKRLDYRICMASNMILNINIYCIMPDDICIKQPRNLYTYKEAKQTLIDRISYMKNELQKFES